MALRRGGRPRTYDYSPLEPLQHPWQLNQTTSWQRLPSTRLQLPHSPHKVVDVDEAEEEEVDVAVAETDRDGEEVHKTAHPPNHPLLRATRRR